MKLTSYFLLIGVSVLKVEVFGYFIFKNTLVPSNSSSILSTNGTIGDDGDITVTEEDEIAETCDCTDGYCEENSLGNLECKCPPEWVKVTGSLCMPCDCGEGANCTFGGRFDPKRCIYNEGYQDIGGTCKESCSPNPCKNGAKCSMNGDKKECMCAPPFFGQFCEKDPCTENPCLNEGKCSIKYNEAKCDCKQPYWGKFCQGGLCTYITCQNGGTCVVSGNKYECICAGQFEGEFCQEESRRNYRKKLIYLRLEMIWTEK